MEATTANPVGMTEGPPPSLRKSDSLLEFRHPRTSSSYGPSTLLP